MLKPTNRLSESKTNTKIDGWINQFTFYYSIALKQQIQFA